MADVNEGVIVNITGVMVELLVYMYPEFMVNMLCMITEGRFYILK